MTQVCTTKEQSQRLLDLGIQRETADMFWPLESSFPEVCDNGDNEQADCPAWSLGALIKLIPDIIFDNKKCYGLSILNIGVYYKEFAYKRIVQGFEGADIFDSCVNMIGWLVKNGYIKTEK